MTEHGDAGNWRFCFHDNGKNLDNQKLDCIGCDVGDTPNYSQHMMTSSNGNIFRVTGVTVMRNSLVEQQVILANAFGSSKNTIYRYHGIVGAAVAIVISIMHEKLCIYMQNTQKNWKISQIPSFTYLEITMVKLLSTWISKLTLTKGRNHSARFGMQLSWWITVKPLV